MGMDVYGLNPTTTAPARPEHNDYDSEDWKAYFAGQSLSGQYFRNNVWWWRPLWDYVADTCSEVISKEDFDAGHHNSGHVIGKEQCEYIAKALAKELLNGGAEQYKKDYEKALSELPLEECTHCKGTGQRDDEYVQGECNGCHGEGERKNFNTGYPFDVDNVREFHSFVKNCGGFEIC
jgi:hypothetical protein|tara:strand:- start:64 stop:597 length:534 start_codon:yes stop_codon:yes gene_type:complete